MMLDTIIDYDIVQSINIMSDKITYKIVAKWGKKNKQGYLLPYSFDDENLALGHADKLMPIFPMDKAELIAKIKDAHPLTASFAPSVSEPICYKSSEICKYDCKGLCKESC